MYIDTYHVYNYYIYFTRSMYKIALIFKQEKIPINYRMYTVLDMYVKFYMYVKFNIQNI